MTGRSLCVWPQCLKSWIVTWIPVRPDREQSKTVTLHEFSI